MPLFQIQYRELLFSGGAVVADGERAVGWQEEEVAFLGERLAVDGAGGGAGEVDDEDGRWGAGQDLVAAGGKGQAIDAGGRGVEEEFAEGRVDEVGGGGGAGGGRSMGQLDIHDVEFDGVFIPDAVDAGFGLEAFEPDIALGEGGFAGFDKGLGPGLCAAKHDEDGGRGVLVEQGSVVGRDVDVEDADPFVRKEFVVARLFAHLDRDLGAGG